LLSLYVSFWRAALRSIPLLLFLFFSNICAHILLDHECIQLNTWLLESPTVRWIIDACIFKLFFNFKAILLFLHDLLCCQDLRVVVEVLLLNFFDALLIFLVEEIKLLIVHFANCTPVVCLISMDALSVKVWTECLAFKSLLPIDIDFNNCGVWINVFSCGKHLKALHAGM
jgi:hypothetical protein